MTHYAYGHQCRRVLLRYFTGLGHTKMFFTELRDVIDRLAMFTGPIFSVGDFNIRLDCPSDPHASTLVDDLASYGCANRVTSATHDHGGMLDVVVTRDDLPAPSVDVIDVDLSNHRLLCWQAPLVRPCSSYSTATSRPWNRLDPAEFRAELLQLFLLRPDAWSSLNIDAMAQLYDDELTTILDRLIPIRTLRFRRRYLSTCRLLPDLQSAYRAYHSTETAVLKFCQTYCLRSTVATWRFWHNWTYRQRSTQSTMEFFSTDSRCHTA